MLSTDPVPTTPSPHTPHENEIHYTVDGEPQVTAEKILTPRTILTNAGVDPASHYLKLLRGESDQEASYENRTDDPIHMHPKMRFISISTGPTPVS